METCQCVHCTGDNFHLEQMAEGAISKDDYMENRPPSVYDKLFGLQDGLQHEPNSSQDVGTIQEIMWVIDSIDSELIALALELPTEQAEKLLAIQERLY